MTHTRKRLPEEVFWNVFAFVLRVAAERLAIHSGHGVAVAVRAGGGWLFAERASGAPHAGPTRLTLTRLLSHAAALGPDARQQGPDFWLRELSGLLGFAFDVLKRAG